jgi:hypothetical protein
VLAAGLIVVATDAIMARGKDHGAPAREVAVE